MFSPTTAPLQTQLVMLGHAIGLLLSLEERSVPRAGKCALHRNEWEVDETGQLGTLLEQRTGSTSGPEN